MLKGKTAVVTGAGAGIGKASALELARNGADVAVLELDPAAGLQTKKELEALGRRAVFIQCDIADFGRIPEVLNQLVSQLGRVDIWVNNAGISINYNLEELTEEQWDKTLDINLKAVFFWSQAALKQMKAQGDGGRLIHISSMGGHKGARFTGVQYVASKAGVLGVMKQLAIHGGPLNITSNAVCPGQIATEMAKKLNMNPDTTGIPLGRFGTPEDVAGAVAFLASPQAAYITASSIDVNGGLYIR